MKTPSLLKDYSRLSDPNLDFFAQSVIVSLTGNASFPTTHLTPSLLNLQRKEAYSTALEKFVTGYRTAIAVKQQARVALLTMMLNLATNLESIARGDRAMPGSSGLTPASEGENVPPPGAPTNFTIASE